MCGFTSSYSSSNTTIQHVYSKWEKDTVLYIKSPVTPVKKLHQDAWLGTLMPSAECWSHVLGHHLDSHRWSVNKKAHLKTCTLNRAVKWNLMQLTVRSVNSKLGGADAVSLTDTSCMCLVQRFPAATHSLSFWICIYPLPSPSFTFSLLNQCEKCLVPLAWGLMAGRCKIISHGGVTLSRGWLCQKWKPLDNPDTHVHQVSYSLCSAAPSPQ